MNEEAKVDSSAMEQVEKLEEKKAEASEKETHSHEIYRTMLERQISALNNDVRYYDALLSDTDKIRLGTIEKKTKAEKELSSLTEELARYNETKEISLNDISYSKREKLAQGDAKYERNAKKISELEASMKELYELKGKAIGNKEKQKYTDALYDKRVALKKLREKQNRISKKQRNILVRRDGIKGLREMFGEHFENKMDALREMDARIDKRRSELGPGILGGLKDLKLDIKQKYYQVNYIARAKMLEVLQNAKIIVTGGESFDVRSELVDALQGKISKAMGENVVKDGEEKVEGAPANVNATGSTPVAPVTPADGYKPVEIVTDGAETVQKNAELSEMFKDQVAPQSVEASVMTK